MRDAGAAAPAGAALALAPLRRYLSGLIVTPWLRRLPAVALALGVAGGDTAPQATAPPFAFRDVSAAAGLLPGLAGLRAHAAGWGDLDGDGWLDLYVGTFPSPAGRNLLFRNRRGLFELDSQPAPQRSSRAGAALFADLDEDGDLDLYLSSLPVDDSRPQATSTAEAALEPTGCALFRNEGGGRLADATAASRACPPGFAGRSATVLDADGDGLLDLLVGGDPFAKGRLSAGGSRLLRNRGGLVFEDVSTAAGLRADLPALGVAAADVDGDGWPDLFLASGGDRNRLLINDRRGRFREAPGSRLTFAWAAASREDVACGVAFGDLDGDGLLDVALGPHSSRPWIEPVAVRLYLHRGAADGAPRWEDVTDRAGLPPLPLKAPHVEIQDFDNDGRPDLYASLIKFADGRPHPLIFRNHGSESGMPSLRQWALEMNGFPSAHDRAERSSGAFLDRMAGGGQALYAPAGPSADYDNDGRLDLFLASWWPQVPSLLLRNESPAGNWLQVRVEGPPGVNRMGIGSRVEVYRAGELGLPGALLGVREIAAGYGYASGQSAIAHFGLGAVQSADLRVALPHGRGVLIRRHLAANRLVTVGGRR